MVVYKDRMNTQRAPGKGMWVGLSLMALSGLVIWRVLVSSHEERGTGESSSKVVQLEQKAGSEQAVAVAAPGSATEVAVDGGGGPELTRSPFLRELGAAVESLRSETDPVKREGRIEEVASKFAKGDIAAAIGFLEGRSASKLYDEMGRRMIRYWAESDPVAAAEWVEGNAKGAGRIGAIQTVAVAWANQSMSGAVDWLKGLPKGEEQQAGLLSAAYEAARTEPIEALRLAVELPATQGREDLVKHAVAQWGTTEPQAAAEWANQIGEEELRDRALAAVTTAWGATDPVAAAGWAVQAIKAGKPQEDAVVGIVQQWVQKEPEEAAAWVLKFPEGNVRNSAMENLTLLWADQDLEQAGNWVQGLEASASRDLAMGAYVRKLGLMFPEVAVAWAEEITNEGTRNAQLEAVAENWMARDEAAARAWVAQSPLSEEAKARVLSGGKN